MNLLLMFVLTCSAGMDRTASFDFKLTLEHRGAIAMYGSVASDLPLNQIGIIWKQIDGPEGLVTQPDALRPFLMVAAPGRYRYQMIAATSRWELCSALVTYTVESKEKQK